MSALDTSDINYFGLNLCPNGLPKAGGKGYDR